MGKSSQEKSNEEQLGETRNVSYLNMVKAIHLKTLLYHARITQDTKILKGILYLKT